MACLGDVMNVDEFCAFVRDLRSDKGYILACLLDLSPVDIQVFEYLESKRDRSADVQEVASKLGRDRSTVQRSLQKLASLEVTQRIKVPGKTRGYKYVYKLLPNDIIKKKLVDIVQRWNVSLLKAIDEVM